MVEKKQGRFEARFDVTDHLRKKVKEGGGKGWRIKEKLNPAGQVKI